MQPLKQASGFVLLHAVFPRDDALLDLLDLILIYINKSRRALCVKAASLVYLSLYTVEYGIR